MSQQYDTGCVPMAAGAAIAQYALVQLSAAGTVITNVLTTRPIGVAQKEAYAAGDIIPVKLWNAPGTFKCIAKEALAAAAVLYTEAGGKVQDTAEATGLPIGIANEAATAENDIIEVIPIHYGGVAAS